tara:strand:+ start:1057 stop:1335 length:279 start_codon:yes stop_codon:yes gene_type:complete
MESCFRWIGNDVARRCDYDEGVRYEYVCEHAGEMAAYIVHDTYRNGYFVRIIWDFIPSLMVFGGNMCQKADEYFNYPHSRDDAIRFVEELFS